MGSDIDNVTISFSWKQLGGSLDMCCAAQDEIWGVNSDCEIYRKKSKSFIDSDNAFDHISLSEFHDPYTLYGLCGYDEIWV